MDENARLHGADFNELRSVEEAQLQTFAAEAEYIKSENPELFSNLLYDLNSSMVQYRGSLIQRELLNKKKFQDRLSALYAPPMSHSEIEAAVNKAASETLGTDAEPRFVSAFKTHTKSIVQNFVQVKHQPKIQIQMPGRNSFC